MNIQLGLDGILNNYVIILTTMPLDNVLSERKLAAYSWCCMVKRLCILEAESLRSGPHLTLRMNL